MCLRIAKYIQKDEEQGNRQISWEVKFLNRKEQFLRAQYRKHVTIRGFSLLLIKSMHFPLKYAYLKYSPIQLLTNVIIHDIARMS